MRQITWWVASVLLLGCAERSNEPAPSPTLDDRCGSLRDHLVALRLDGVTADRAKHERAHREALGAGFLEDCAKSRDDAQLSCALAATDSGAVSACLGGAR